jgi:drug/metabolite transporter (DMT)-like permease
VILSPIAYLLFGLLASRVNLAVAGSLVNLMIMVGAVLMGVFYFKEHITGLQWTGIILGAVAILILSVGANTGATMSDTVGPDSHSSSP